MERVLEVLVQGIEEPITEAPEEEQDGDEANRVDGLAEGELGGPGAGLVIGFETAAPEPLLDGHGDGEFRMTPGEEQTKTMASMKREIGEE